MSVPPLDNCVIATRESRLALWQAEHVQTRLRELYPQLVVSLLGMTTRGDQVLDRPLAQIGGKGLFVKELETALAEGRADLAVHSMKDVPMTLPDGFSLDVFGPREDARDALVSNRYRSLVELPPGAVVGTSSLRRECQIRARYPHLEVKSLRGNVETRLRKLDEGHYAVIVLAAAGLRRLGLGDRIAALLDTAESLPAVGQGALAVEYRTDRPDVAALLEAYRDPATFACVTAERAFSRKLAGSCDVPLAGHADLADGRLRIRGLVATRDGSRLVQDEVRGAADDAAALGEALAGRLLDRGAQAILETLR
jgi:hydroxymethylbilane synthase